ncbi:MAG: TonB-dependent receptor [Prevotella sp.]|nr:TonB-dependent receptor [Prevotella sp.]
MAAGAYSPTESLDLLDSSRVRTLDEIVVLSQPKEVFRLRQQPLSATMVSKDELSWLGAHDLRELSSYVPSFAMPNYGSRYTSSIYVRGIGSRINSPAVGIYMDGMPIMCKSAFNLHTYQLERVDILRGPQGTLYGQNNEGGMIRMFSLNPMNYQGTDVSIGAGTRFYRNAEMAHYQKVNGKVAFSLAGFYNGQNGFFRNQTTGERADNYDEAGGKVRLVLRPTSRWSINYIADYQYVNQNGFPYGKFDLASGVVQQPSTNYQSNYRRNVFNTGLSVDLSGNAFELNSTTTYQYMKDYMMMDQDYLPQDFMHFEERQFQNSFTQEFSVKSRQPVGGFWRWANTAFFSAQWLKTNSPVYFGQEMNKWLSASITQYAYQGMLMSMVNRMVAQGMSEEAARKQAEAAIARAGGVNIEMDMGTVSGLFRTPQYNIGVAHESNFNITDRLIATLGLRFDYSHVSIDYATGTVMSLDESVMGQKVQATVSSLLKDKIHNRFNQLLPKFGLLYRVDRTGSNVYATVSKGYRAGGYNMQMFSDILQSELQRSAQKARGNMDIEHTDDDYRRIANTIAYKPETSWNYEAGAHINLFGNSLHLDMAAFYMRVLNQQLSVMARGFGFGRMMVNSGKSHSCGIEATFHGRVFDNRLDWGVGYSYTRAIFDEYVDSVLTTNTAVNYKGKFVPYVPQHMLSARADYQFNFGHACLRSIILGVNANMQGKTYWDNANTYSQKIYAVLGAHADADFGWLKVSLWGRNLTDTRYNTFAFDSGATGETLYFAHRGSPFQMGLDFKVHF